MLNATIMFCQFKLIYEKVIITENWTEDGRRPEDLGIIVDHELKFKRHIQDITTRARQRASLILRCFKSKDPFFAVQGICDLRATTPGV